MKYPSFISPFIFFLLSLLSSEIQTIDKSIGDEYIKLADTFMQENNFHQAQIFYQNTLEIDPHHALAHKGMAHVFFKQQQYQDALLHIKKADSLLPYDYNIIHLQGKILRSLHHFDEAVELFISMLEIDPNTIVPIFEIANTYNLQGKMEKALLCYEKILEIAPNIREAQYNYAHTLKQMGYIEEAISLYEDIIERYPDYASVQFSLALAYLSVGNFEKGWPKHEWRWAAYKESPYKFSQPIWDGSNPAGKTILIYAEQGLGDTFQFIRYVRLLKKLGAKIIFQSQKPASDILKQCDYIDQIIVRGEILPSFDMYIPLMSLPLVFNTTTKTIPQDIPYLHASSDLIDYWGKQLAQDDTQQERKKSFKIGICWQGNTNYSSATLQHTVAAKSIPLSVLSPLAHIPGVVLYSLQKMNGEDQIENIDFKINTFGPDLDTEHGRFMDTAAIMHHLDLVLTVDTSISHLAGALGIRTWLMLPNPADWRWIIGRDDTPWYPENMRLFKQPSPGDWHSVISKVAQELEDLLAKIA